MGRTVLMSLVPNFILFLFTLAQQQQYPNLWNVEIHAHVTHYDNGQMFIYTYALTNGASNRGEISRLEIDISKDPAALDIDTVGLRFENDGFTEESFRRHFRILKGKIVPIGFSKTPGESWLGGLTNSCKASFSSDSDYVRPGEALGGFEMMSKGLPTIRRCIVSPFFDVLALFPDPQDTTITYYVPPIDSVRNAVRFYGSTVGPGAPPMNFVPIVWLDTLLSYTRQSAEIGWLGRSRDNDCDDDERPDDGITKNIERRLQKARKELSKGDSVKARKELEKLVDKVERIWKRSQQEEKKHKRDKWEKRDDVIMTSEAYALLKYNTEYLIDRLPGEKKKGKKEKKGRDKDDD